MIMFLTGSSLSIFSGFVYLFLYAMTARVTPIHIPSEIANTCRLFVDEDRKAVQKANDTIDRLRMNAIPIS